jgi:hypothetical protein
MKLGYVGRVVGGDISDLDSHTYASLIGKDALVFNYFNREVTVIGYDTAGETKYLGIVSDALGCVTPQTGKMVVLIIHQGTHFPQLEHNLLSTMQVSMM